jgi:hypothetical protein
MRFDCVAAPFGLVTTIGDQDLIEHGVRGEIATRFALDAL